MSVHANLTGADLHESKSVSSANIKEVYVADGAGSGAWTAETYVLTVLHADAANATVVYLAAPFAGKVIKIWSVITATFDVNTVITGKINAVAITDGAFTIAASGSAAGVGDNTTPSAANTVAAGDSITFTSDGAGTTVGDVAISVEMSRTA